MGLKKLVKRAFKRVKETIFDPVSAVQRSVKDVKRAIRAPGKAMKPKAPKEKLEILPDKETLGSAERGRKSRKRSSSASSRLTMLDTLG